MEACKVVALLTVLVLFLCVNHLLNLKACPQCEACARSNAGNGGPTLQPTLTNEESEELDIRRHDAANASESAVSMSYPSRGVSLMSYEEEAQNVADASDQPTLKRLATPLSAGVN